MKEKKIFEFLKDKLRALGFKLGYSALLLFYAYRNPDTPRWAKNVVLGALGYLLTPFDSVVDFTPVLGYTDDFGVLSFALVTIGAYISDDVKINARKKLRSWTGDLDLKELQRIEEKL
ncbi:YkvA family protein [Membranihabitans maritimus]|uniref:YkvA family protein n=1 Tax=Membranihabitans maritimus TaxID=2904244 RepID=UPI001F482BEE|nr:YkvA family protein [Membranihabitans maritimus]